MHALHEHIDTLDVLLECIKRIKEKTKTQGQQDWTANQRRLLDIAAFMESALVYQSPWKFKPLLGAHLSQNDFETVAKIAASDRMQALGGLACIYSESRILNVVELYHYLEEISGLIDNACPLYNKPLAMLFSNLNHSIALTYQAKHGWGFWDINQYPATHNGTLVNTSTVNKLLCAGFLNAHHGPYIAFQVKCMTTADALYEDLKQSFNGRKPYLITRKIAQRVERVNLAWIAAYHGDAGLLTKLAEHGTNLNKADDLGNTPAHLAAMMGHPDVMAILGEYDANLPSVFSCHWWES